MSEPQGDPPTQRPQGPDGPSGPNGSGPQRPPNRYSRSLLAWVLIIVIGLILMSVIGQGFENRRQIHYGQFWTYVENGSVVDEIKITDDRILGQVDPAKTPGLAEGEPAKFELTFDYRTEENFIRRLDEALDKYPGQAWIKQEPTSWWQSMLPSLLLTVLVIAAMYFFLFRRLGAGGGGAGFLGSFGRSKHRVLSKEHTSITFDDVAGIQEAKEEVQELIEFLKNPRRFQRIGGRVPRGVLLVGEPGCGKTLLAKAIAGEAEVPFFSISGSDFVEMFVGVGASRVRDLFKQAKESSPCIIFLDEIDAVGRRRGVGFGGGGHDEREQTLNAILVEMDGFESSDQVIVCAATNRADVLDPALTRPGRFDRQIQVPLPDLRGRYEILKIYAGKVKCSPDVDLHRVARGTPMFSGADLEALVNEAAISATMAEKDHIEQADLEEARDKVRWGRARKSRVMDEREKECTAYHEAGHALVQYLLPEIDPLHKVSIIPRGPAGGATFSLPEKDRYFYTRKFCKAQLCVLLAGQMSEESFCGDVSSGAASDIANATQLAKRMVLDWGMSEKLGFIRYSSDENQGPLGDVGGKEYSEHTAELIDTEIRDLVAQARQRTADTLKTHYEQVQNIAKALLKYETLNAEDVRRIIEGESLSKPTVNELIDLEQTKSPTPEAEGDTRRDGPLPEGGGILPEPG